MPQEPEDDPEPIAWASANACKIGVDLTVSYSNGKEGSPPTDVKVLQLSWDEVVSLVEERGRSLPRSAVDVMVDAVEEFNNGAGS